jgi:hypothetical protein
VSIKLYILILFIASLSACSYFSEQDIERKLIARAYDKYLYLDELSENIPDNISEEDSIILAKALIKNWIEKQLLVYQAEVNLPNEKKDMEQKLADYRNDLLIYTYQSELLLQKLDTAVSDKEIESYYNENKSNFELKDYIVKVFYVKLDPNAPNLKKVEAWLSSNKADDRLKLEDYCYQFAQNYYLDDKSWLYFDDLLKEIPIEEYNIERFLRSNKLVKTSDSESLYLLYIIDYKLKDSLSPLILEKDNIRNIILNKRKRNFVSTLKKDLFEEAERKNNFEIYP